MNNNCDCCEPRMIQEIKIRAMRGMRAMRSMDVFAMPRSQENGDNMTRLVRRGHQERP